MENYQWITSHNTAERTMTHVFQHGRIMVLTDFNTGLAHVQKDGNPLYSIDVDYKSVDEYTQELVALAKEDERLSQFSIR